MPDSPNYTRWRNPGFYSRPGMSRLIPGAGERPNENNEELQPSMEERLQQAIEEIAQMCQQNDQLKKELQDAQQGTNRPKGKEPEQGRLPPPLNIAQPLYQRTDRYLVPWAPPKWEPLNPVSATNDDAPYLGIKPILLQPPKAFKGEHDDIMRFFGDCLAYFKVFRGYFANCPSLMVTFTSSHFDRPAKDWWVHKQQEFWMNSEWDKEPPRFQYPTWDEFMGMTEAQF